MKRWKNADTLPDAKCDSLQAVWLKHGSEDQKRGQTKGTYYVDTISYGFKRGRGEENCQENIGACQTHLAWGTLNAGGFLIKDVQDEGNLEEGGIDCTTVGKELCLWTLTSLCEYRMERITEER